MTHFLLNDEIIQTDQPTGMTMLDFVRYHQHLVGTKIGCREGDCGACTVLVGELKGRKLVYQSMTSCLMPLGNAEGKHIVTVEGLNMEKLSPVQKAIVEEGGTQCGFCTVGFVLSLSGFALSHQATTYQNAIAAIDGNICRCTGYKSLERAAEKITNDLLKKETKKPIEWLVKNQFLPTYFLEVKKQLQSINKSKVKPKILPKKKVIVGGGTDLFVQRPEEMVESNIQHVFNNEKLKEITKQKDHCYIGAACTAEDIQRSPIMQKAFPDLRAHIKLVSSTPIRNMGTLAGNLVNASPIGDLTIFFLALDASIQLNHQGKKRNLKLRNFYKGYKKLSRKKEEFIEMIFFKIPEKKIHYNFEKVCKRKHLDIASVNSACQFKVEKGVIIEVHLSAGGVGPIPKYLVKTCKFLIGKNIDITTIQQAAAIMNSELSPISDARGSAEYKRLLLRQLFYAHFLKFFPQEISLKSLVAQST